MKTQKTIETQRIAHFTVEVETPGRRPEEHPASTERNGFIPARGGKVRSQGPATGRPKTPPP